MKNTFENVRNNVTGCLCDNWKPSFVPCLTFNWRTFSKPVIARW